MSLKWHFIMFPESPIKFISVCKEPKADPEPFLGRFAELGSSESISMTASEIAGVCGVVLMSSIFDALD